MRMGIFFRNFGPVSTPGFMTECASAAESMGLDNLWVSDHIAIPPEESEGSGGRYMDPLATLAYLAGITKTIALGTSVLIVPYRPPLITAKWIATVQELCGGRLSIGASVGWMESEFRAVGVELERRGTVTDETLEFWHQCFNQDEVTVNGQKFLFKPRPERPKFLIGGAAPHAINRAVKFGDGWLPAEGDPDKLSQPIADLKRRMKEAGKPAPEVVTLTGLPLDDRVATVEKLQGLAEVGVTGVDHAGRYENVDEFREIVASMLEARIEAGLD